MKKPTDTKERIEEIALDLFSKCGYKAVSIRDICKELGFTESSIYYHFRNKQAIMDALLEKVEILIESKSASFDAAFEKARTVSEEEMGKVAVGVLVAYLLNPYVFKIISVLTLERMSDPKAYETYQKIVFTLPLAQQEKAFRQMIDRGFILPNDPAVLAEQYYAIIYFAFQKNCIGAELDETVIAKTAKEIEENIRDFFRKLK